MTTDEKIDYLYRFIKALEATIPKYDENGLRIEKCYLCGSEFKTHPEMCVSQRLQFYGRDDICHECMTKELEKRGIL